MSGFEIYNADGYLQFSPDFLPFSLRNKTGFYAGGEAGSPLRIGGNRQSSGTAYYTQTIDVGFSGAIVAIHSTTSATVFWQSGSTVSIAFQRADAYITLYCFGKYSSAPDPGIGLALYDASGNLTFSSADKPMKPVYQAPAVIVQDDGSGFTHTPPTFFNYSLPGRKIAFIPSNRGTFTHTTFEYRRTNPNTFEDEYDLTATIYNMLGRNESDSKVVGDDLVRTIIKSPSANEEQFWTGGRNGRFTIIDVTNY